MATTGTIMIIISIIIIMTSMNRSLSLQHLQFLYLPILKQQENASLLPYKDSGFVIQLPSPSPSIEFKRWHLGLLFKRVISLSLSLQEKQVVKLMQCAVTNALEMPKAQA